MSDQANDYCACLAGVAEEKYPKASEALALSFAQMIKLSKDCLDQVR